MSNITPPPLPRETPEQASQRVEREMAQFYRDRAAFQTESKVRQSRDRAQYVRQQKGHSLILNLLLVGPLTLYITTVYYSVSPNHYWHA